MGAPVGLVLAVLLMACAWLSSCVSAAFAAGDADRESCGEVPSTEASPGFRSFLPDCRAYELSDPTVRGWSTRITGLEATAAGVAQW